MASNGTSDNNNYRTIKNINDPIHGLMEFEDWIVKFIDTEHFQRLRNIKQLGTAYYVYPGASHNRFEHSLGVAHLTYTLLKRIQQKQPELKLSDKNVKCVTLAALCHDLGHGPFSHLFEKQFLKPFIEEWHHDKDGSSMMFEDLISKNKNIADDLDKEDIEFIKALIVGDREKDGQEICKGRPRYLFDIVANKTNEIDVDKFDYLARDCYYLGMRSVFDFSRLLKFSRVVDNQIMYYHKECYNIYELFHTRYTLYKNAYRHRVVMAIDYMVRDALIEANDVFKISDSVKDPSKFLRMDDTILNRIECSENPDLEKSKAIIKRIRTRQLYKYVDEFLVDPKDNKLAEEVEKKMKNEGEGLKDYNVIVERKLYRFVHDKFIKETEPKPDEGYDFVYDVMIGKIKLNYSMKDGTNPVKQVKFYNKNFKQTNGMPKVSNLITEQYEEIYFLAFTKDPDPKKAEDKIKENFQKLVKEKFNECAHIQETK